jgi:hypothetical protein
MRKFLFYKSNTEQKQMSSYNQSFHFDRTKCVNLIIGVSGIYFSYIIAGLMNERMYNFVVDS